ncbi:hypothetical protein BG005_004783 [Podila minutissima]|nr:hypothetical protein BG005_004783 [Podila minutissima]
MATSTGITKFIHHKGARLLYLDGGGVRGIVSLIILDNIMKRVQERKRLTEVPRPSDYFELAAGTSAGGITAIMLFWLHMTTEQAIEQYKSISQEAFRPKIFGFGVPTWMEGFVSSIKTVFTTRFDSTALDKAIDSVVERYGLDPDDKDEKREAPLYHSQHVGGGPPPVLQNHRFHHTFVDKVLLKGQDEITIGLTVRATSAAPTYFPEEVWKPDNIEDGLWESEGAKDGLKFWDGGLLNNNPINQLWYARYDVVGPEESEPPISCVISLGTGRKDPGGQRPGLWVRLVDIATSVVAFVSNTNAESQGFKRHMENLNRRPGYGDTKYIRLNPDLKQYNIGLADYTKMRELEDLTIKYLQEEGTKESLQEAVEAICPLDDTPRH